MLSQSLHAGSVPVPIGIHGVHERSLAAELLEPRGQLRDFPAAHHGPYQPQVHQSGVFSIKQSTSQPSI